MDVSKTNSPLCRYHWNLDHMIFFTGTLHIHGVPRIHDHPDASRIYFVQNPLQLIILKETVEDPIYIKPCKITYSYNDYQRMVKGKEVIFCRMGLPFSYVIEDMLFESFDGNEEIDFFTPFGEKTP